ncbi:DUF3099 domain-containing protein [Nocardioides sp. Bht2]|uniref:DUF3099 domain-containing protein n=1 Tax=Nocardioides sp. Bht2 TaxID=3392297 RepID=UPI0039B4C93C
MSSRASRRDSEAIRITTAEPGRGEDLSARQRRYVISMAIRAACFLGAVAIGPGFLRWILFAGAIFLPYFAVVMANAVPMRRNEETELTPHSAMGRELPRKD